MTKDISLHCVALYTHVTSIFQSTPTVKFLATYSGLRLLATVIFPAVHTSTLTRICLFFSMLNSNSRYLLEILVSRCRLAAPLTLSTFQLRMTTIRLKVCRTLHFFAVLLGFLSLSHSLTHLPLELCKLLLSHFGRLIYTILTIWVTQCPTRSLAGRRQKRIHFKAGEKIDDVFSKQNKNRKK